MMKIEVAESGWGIAHTGDVQILLEDTASHINNLLRTPFTGSIHVIPAPSKEQYPMTHYRRIPDGPISIQLTARDTYWAQFAYQFSHEFCHAISGYERLRNNPNNWFHESICEMASIFTLRRMSETWIEHPPYSSWSDYASSLAQYAEDRLMREEVQLPSDVTLRDWVSVREDKLRGDPYMRELNDTIAYAILPLFEENPGGWNAIPKLPVSLARLHTYMREWNSNVAQEEKAFVSSISIMLL